MSSKANKRRENCTKYKASIKSGCRGGGKKRKHQEWTK